MTTRIDYAELPDQVKAAYDSTYVKRISKRTTKAGEATYTVETYSGTHRWKLLEGSWQRAGAEE